MESIERRLMLSAAAAPATAPIILHPTLQPLLVNSEKHQIGSANPNGFITPAQMQGAYGVNAISLGGVTGNGAGQTIAIVDAYDFPTAAADLQAFDAFYGLPNAPSFTKVNEQGLTAPLPGTDPNGAGSFLGTWEEEEALDIEWAHVIAPAASIELFEASSPSTADLNAATQAAARAPGVSVVSMSFSGDEDATILSQDSVFTTPTGHQGVTFVAAAGDNGIYDQFGSTPAPQYPASSPNVVAVGGTTLTTTGTSYGGETGWGNSALSADTGGGGGGISAYESQPTYQRFLDNQSNSFRTYPDVAMDADPHSGVSIYDSYDFGTTTPWAGTATGGTSLATPMFAALIAIANQGRVLNGLGTLNGASETLPRLYNIPAADYHDITTGSNGYQAAAGYDLVTGRGTPVANLLVPDLAASYIGSFVFNDVNTNGIQDHGETGVAGVTVTLKTAGADGIIGNGDDTTLQVTTTDSSGLYEFVGIGAGSYYVNFTLPSGSTFSPMGTGFIPIANSSVNPATGNTGLITVAANAEYKFANVGVYQQDITINDVTITRPHSGLAAMTFTVTLSPADLTGASVPFTTVDGSATVANGDYIANSGTLVFPAGVTTETITVEAVGNLKIENDVSYTVHITAPTSYVGLKTIGVGTIINSNFPVATVTGPAPQTRSSTVSLTYPFVIHLSAAAPFTVSVPYTTADQSATAGNDYQQVQGTAIFTAGTTTETIDVTVFAGTSRQLDKVFLFELSTPVAPVTEELGSPSSAPGTILTNAFPAVSAGGAEVSESLTGLAYLPFAVNVAPSLTSGFTVNYTTSDGTAIAGKDYQAESGTLTFGPGQIQQIVYVPVYSQFIPQQQKTLDFTISNPSSTIDVIDPVVTGTIDYLNLTALPFSTAHRAVYTDALGQRVTVSMRGVGSGDVVFLGNSSTATNAYELMINGTNTASSVTVSVARGGQTSLTDLIASAPVGTINAKTTNIVGSVSGAGSIGSLNLGYVEGSVITIGGAGSGVSAALSFNRVLNSTINSAIPIKSLTASAYVNTTGSPIYITAPSVGVVKVKGTFGGTITTTTVAALIVGGEISSGAIYASGSIGNISAGGIVDSTFFAGVTSPTGTLPTSADDFSSAKSTIQSVSVQKGGVFSDSLIAGWTVKNVNVGKVSTNSGSEIFGVSADHLGKVYALAGDSSQLVALNHPVEPTAVDNFLISPL
jgi:subtilase family serine protease